MRVVSQDISTPVETSPSEPRGPEVPGDLEWCFLLGIPWKFVVLRTSNPKTSELRPGRWRGMSCNSPRGEGRSPARRTRGAQEGLRARGPRTVPGSGWEFWEGPSDSPAAACSQPCLLLTVSSSQNRYTSTFVYKMRIVRNPVGSQSLSRARPFGRAIRTPRISCRCPSQAGGAPVFHHRGGQTSPDALREGSCQEGVHTGKCEIGSGPHT